MIIVHNSDGTSSTAVVYGPADPRAVVYMCIIGAVLTVVAAFKGYMGMVSDAGSALIAVLNFIIIPFFLIRIGINAFRRRWLRVLVGIALIPAIGYFTYSESLMMPHAKRYFFASRSNDTALAGIKYAAPVSWQQQLVDAPERTKLFARIGGTFGLTLASMDPALHKYIGLSAFQQRCVSSTPITQEDAETAASLRTLFSRARLGYVPPTDHSNLCGNEQAIMQNYGLSLKEMLATELADNRASLAKVDAMGDKFAATCEQNTREATCAVIGPMLLRLTNDGSPLLDCGNRNGCAVISLPNPHGNPDIAAWGTGSRVPQAYADWSQSLKSLRDSSSTACYGDLCRALYRYLH